MENAKEGALYEVTCNNITAGVVVYNCIIVGAAPVLKRFVGQHISKLVNWISDNGGAMILLP